MFLSLIACANLTVLTFTTFDTVGNAAESPVAAPVAAPAEIEAKINGKIGVLSLSENPKSLRCKRGRFAAPPDTTQPPAPKNAVLTMARAIPLGTITGFYTAVGWPELHPPRVAQEPLNARAS